MRCCSVWRGDRQERESSKQEAEQSKQQGEASERRCTGTERERIHSELGPREGGISPQKTAFSLVSRNEGFSEDT